MNRPDIFPDDLRAFVHGFHWNGPSSQQENLQRRSLVKNPLPEICYGLRREYECYHTYIHPNNEQLSITVSLSNLHVQRLGLHTECDDDCIEEDAYYMDPLLGMCDKCRQIETCTHLRLVLKCGHLSKPPLTIPNAEHVQRLGRAAPCECDSMCATKSDEHIVTGICDDCRPDSGCVGIKYKFADCGHPAAVPDLEPSQVHRRRIPGDRCRDFCHFSERVETKEGRCEVCSGDIEISEFCKEVVRTCTCGNARETQKLAVTKDHFDAGWFLPCKDSCRLQSRVITTSQRCGRCAPRKH
jgi:hypothetical protein